MLREQLDAPRASAACPLALPPRPRRCLTSLSAITDLIDGQYAGAFSGDDRVVLNRKYTGTCKLNGQTSAGCEVSENEIVALCRPFVDAPGDSFANERNLARDNQSGTRLICVVRAREPPDSRCAVDEIYSNAGLIANYAHRTRAATPLHSIRSVSATLFC